MGAGTDRVAVVVGSFGTIECAITENGSVPAKDFLDSLDASSLRQLDTLFHRLADTGKIHNKEQFKKLSGRIYEFKRYQIRMGCFQIRNNWRLTHGFTKKDNKWPKRELDKAVRIMEEDLERDAPAPRTGAKRKPRQRKGRRRQ